MVSPAPPATLAARKRRAVANRHSISGRRSPATLRKGFIPQAKQISDLKTLPIPAITRWFNSTLPTSSSPCSSSRARGLIGGKRRSQQIGSQPGDSGKPLQSARGVEAGDRHIEGDGQQIIRAQHDAHVAARAVPPLPDAVDVPAAAHQHVRGQDEIAGEMHEQPFAARLHLLDDAAGHRALIVHAGQRRIGGFKEGDFVAGKALLQSASGAEDGIAFRHEPLSY